MATTRRIKPQRWWAHPQGATVWSLATHPTHDRVMAGGTDAARSLWVLGADEARCAGYVAGELRAAQWIDDARVVLVVEARPSGQPAGPVTVLVRDATGCEADRVVAALPNAGYRTTLTVDRAGRRAVVNTNEAVHLVDLTAGAPRVADRGRGVAGARGHRAGRGVPQRRPRGDLVPGAPRARRGAADHRARYGAGRRQRAHLGLRRRGPRAVNARVPAWTR